MSDADVEIGPTCACCGYCLRGLPEPRCPECGVWNDPDEAPTSDFGRKLLLGLRAVTRPVTVLVIWVPLAWIASGLGPLSLLYFVGLIASLFSIRSLLIYVLLTPPTLFFILGFGSYRWGDGYYYGGTRREWSFRLHSEYRCRYVRTWDVIDGDEWVQRRPHNFGVKVAHTLFNVPPQYYRGPIPTAEQLDVALRGAPTSSADELRTQGLLWSRGPIRIDPKLLDLIYDGLSSRDVRPLQAVVWQDRCVLLRFRMDGLTWRAIAVDTFTGQPVAFFAQPSSHYPWFTIWRWRSFAPEHPAAQDVRP